MATFFKVAPDIIEQPEVRKLAEGLEMPVFAAVGAVSLLYAWGFEHAAADGGINDFTTKAIENACSWDGERGGLIAMFCAAGILDGDPEERSENDPLRIARWDEIAADLRKVREQTRKRVAKHRENINSVTRYETRYETRNVTDDVTRPRVENRELRIESGESEVASPPAKPSRARFEPPTGDTVREYMQRYAAQKGMTVDAADQAERFVDHFTANGWKVSGKTPMQDWQASARNWLRNRNQFPEAPSQPRAQNSPLPFRFATGDEYR